MRSTCAGIEAKLTGGAVDSYRSLLIGRERLDAVAVPGATATSRRFCRRAEPQDAVTPGENYELYRPDWLRRLPTEDKRQPDLATQMKFFDYPWRRDQIQRVRHTAGFVRPL